MQARPHWHMTAMDRDTIDAFQATSLIRASVAVLIVVITAMAASSQEHEPSLENRFATAYARAAPSVVRVSWRHHGDFTISRPGVILTADGYVGTIGFDPTPEIDDLQPGKEVTIHLSDCRAVKGRAVTSSLHCGIVKIEDEGKWPHVERGTAAETSLGSWCIAVGFDSPPVKDAFTVKPFLHPERVSMKGEHRWLATTHRLGGGTNGSGLFNLDGQLIGIRTGAGNADAPYRVFLSAESLMAKLNKLLARDREVKDTVRPASDRDVPIPAPDDAQLHPALTEASAYSVRIDHEGRPRVSGTLVSRSGHIATCAHHDWPHGTEVTVQLSGYSHEPQIVGGKVLGSDPLLDIGLVQIFDNTRLWPWRHAQFGNPSRMKPGDLCLTFGFPGELQHKRLFCQTRAGRITNTWFAPEQLESSCQIDGGMSGGGVFDDEGRFIGVNQGGYNFVDTWHRGSELFRQHWAFLLNGPETAKLPTLDKTEPVEPLLRGVASLNRCVVEILPPDGDVEQPFIALGTIVSNAGHVLTKASLLYGEVRCRFADGKVLPSEVVKLSRDLDLALMKVDGKTVSQIRWSNDTGISLGQFVAVSGDSETTLVGAVSQPIHEVPNVQGWLVVGNIKDGQGGVEIEDLFGIWKDRSPLRIGDVITHVEQRPTPDMKAFEELTVRKNVGWGVDFVNAGDPIRVGILRDGKKHEFVFPLLHDYWDQLTGIKSRRCAGFDTVFDVEISDVSTTASLCGAPVRNRSGEVLGIVIARVGDHRHFVIPASKAKEFIGTTFNE